MKIEEHNEIFANAKVVFTKHFNSVICGASDDGIRAICGAFFAAAVEQTNGKMGNEFTVRMLRKVARDIEALDEE